MRAARRIVGEIFADGHQFYLVGGQNLHHLLPAVNGLISVGPDCAAIVTGVARGPVVIIGEAWAERPPLLALDHWTDVIEVSIDCPSGHLMLSTLGETTPPFPSLADIGVMTRHRLRVHVTGRDTAPDQVVERPVEEYFIQVWPDPGAAEAVYKQFDHFGAAWRDAAKQAPMIHQTSHLTGAEDARLREAQLKVLRAARNGRMS